MGSAYLHTRRAELIREISDIQYELTGLNSQSQKYTQYSSAIANGVNFSPEALASCGGELYGHALDTMGHARDAATEAADEQTAAYANMFYEMGQDQYNASGLSAKAAIYADENGDAVVDYAWNQFYEQALKDFIEQQVMPLINEEQKEIDQTRANLEALLQQKQSEEEHSAWGAVW